MSFEQQETRIGTVELRDDGSTQQITGYAAVFDALSENLGGFCEKIDHDAFAEVLNDDVRALFNHEPHLILGRTSANTLRLNVDHIGLHYQIEPPDTQYAQDIIKSIRRRDVTQSSFAFQVEDDQWSEDDEGRMVRTIKKFKRLYDISPVTYAAYPDTAVAVRSLRDYTTNNTILKTELATIAAVTRKLSINISVKT